MIAVVLLASILVAVSQAEECPTQSLANGCGSKSYRQPRVCGAYYELSDEGDAFKCVSNGNTGRCIRSTVACTLPPPEQTPPASPAYCDDLYASDTGILTVDSRYNGAAVEVISNTFRVYFLFPNDNDVDPWCKDAAVTGIQGDADSLASLDVTQSHVQTIQLPNLETVTAFGFFLDGNDDLESIEFPKLKEVTGARIAIWIKGNSALHTIELASLQTVVAHLDINNIQPIGIDVSDGGLLKLPALQSVTAGQPWKVKNTRLALPHLIEFDNDGTASVVDFGLELSGGGAAAASLDHKQLIAQPLGEINNAKQAKKPTKKNAATTMVPSLALTLIVAAIAFVR